LAGGCPQPVRGIWFVPDGFSRAEQEHGLQSGAKACRTKLWFATKLIGVTRLGKKSIRFTARS
jgi:hypothetical protein